MVAFVVLWLSSVKVDTLTRVQILFEAVCISNSANNLAKVSV